MRVLFLTHCFIREKGDLAGVFLFDLASELVRRGIEVFVVAPHEKNLPYFEKIDGISIYRFRYAPSKFERLAYQGNMHELVKGSLFYQFIFILFLASSLLKSIWVINREKINLIHAHWWIPSGIIGALVSKIKNIPLVLTFHGTDFQLLKSHIRVKNIATAVIKRAYQVTVVSSFIKKELEEMIKFTEDKEIQVIPMPVNIGKKQNNLKKHKKGMKIATLCRLTEQKGINYLLEACNILKEKGITHEILILGDGPERKNLEKLAENLGLEIEFKGAIPHNEVSSFLEDCDLFVLPAIGEGFGISLVEAMNCKKPVIGTNSGGIPDIIKEGETGLLVPERDPKALADAIEKLLKDEKLANQLAENGYKYVIENFTSSKIVDRILNIYLEVCP